VIVLYSIEEWSVPRAMTCGVVVVVAEGALVKTVGGGMLFNTGSLDIEDNTNSFVGL